MVIQRPHVFQNLYNGQMLRMGFIYTVVNQDWKSTRCSRSGCSSNQRIKCRLETVNVLAHKQNSF